MPPLEVFVSQPPAGGYPPPDPSQPGSYPPPGQYGPPAGSSPAPAGGYPPPADPAGYQPPPAGYQPPPPGYQPPPPGYTAPPPGYSPPPPGYQQDGGYPPPAGGYPPPAPGYQGGAPAFPPAGGSGSAGFDISKLGTVSRGILGASLLTLIGSFFNFWKVSSTFVSGGYSGWSLWWWIPVVLAVAVGVVYALTLFGQLKPGQVKPEYLFYGAAASFVLMIFVFIHTLVYDGPYGIFDGGEGLSSGPGFGVVFTLIATLVLTYFTAVAAKNAGAKLPFKVPGPALH